MRGLARTLTLALVMGCSTSSGGGVTPLPEVNYKQPVDPAGALRSAVFVASCMPDDSVTNWLSPEHEVIKRPRAER